MRKVNRLSAILGLLLFLSLLPPQEAFSASSIPSNPTPLSTFKFAPNGVCIEPYHFVLANDDDDKSSSSSSSKDSTPRRARRDNNNNNNKRPRLFTMRNVPGEGDCMFLAVALAAATSMGLGGNDALLRAISKETRQVVAQVLEYGRNHVQSVLVVEGHRLVTAHQLLESATQQLGLDNSNQYLKLVRKEGRDGGLYGGGPELTVLSNVLRRPISIYELVPTNNSNDDNNDNDDDDKSRCLVECVGTFGDVFQDPCNSIPNSAVKGAGLQPGAYSWHLHILVLDASPNEKHACVLLPQD